MVQRLYYTIEQQKQWENKGIREKEEAIAIGNCYYLAHSFSSV